MTRTRTILSWLIFGAALVAMVIPLPGKDTSHLLSASEANDDSLVILTTAQAEMLAPIVDTFTEKHNIPVRVESILPADLTQKTIASTQADLILVSDVAELTPLMQAGALDTLPPDLMWNVETPFHDNANRWIGYTGRLEVLVYNPALVDPTELNTSTLRSTETELDNKTVLDAVLAGDLPMGVVDHDLISQDIAAQIGIHLFNNAHMTVSAFAMAQSANSKPIAQLFLSLIYLPTAQNLLTQSTGHYSFLAFGVEAPADFPVLSELNLVDFGTLFSSDPDDYNPPANQVASTN